MADVDGLLRRLTAKQFLEWQIFDILDPFGAERADARTGAVVQVLKNVHRAKGRKAFTIAECTPYFGDARGQAAKPQKNDQTWKQMKHVAMIMTAASKVEARRKRGS